MFFNEDTTFHDIREKSVKQWLNEMKEHEDIAVRGGVKVTLDYIEYLKSEIQRLEDKNLLKNEYLKKLKDKNECKSDM